MDLQKPSSSSHERSYLCISLYWSHHTPSNSRKPVCVSNASCGAGCMNFHPRVSPMLPPSGNPMSVHLNCLRWGERDATRLRKGSSGRDQNWFRYEGGLWTIFFEVDLCCLNKSVEIMYFKLVMTLCNAALAALTIWFTQRLRLQQMNVFWLYYPSEAWNGPVLYGLHTYVITKKKKENYSMSSSTGKYSIGMIGLTAAQPPIFTSTHVPPRLLTSDCVPNLSLRRECMRNQCPEVSADEHLVLPVIAYIYLHWVSRSCAW